jgi:hypothetical protein
MSNRAFGHQYLRCERGIVVRLPSVRGIKGRCDMKTRGDFRKFLTIAIAIGVLAGAGGKPTFAKDRHLSNAGRPAAIHDCNIEANKYSPITQLPNQFAVYGTCMVNHGQRFG